MRLTNKDKRQYWILENEDHPENTLTWIDGIGSYHGFFWPPNFPMGDYGDIKLTCYYKHEQLYHINPEIDDCSIVNNTDFAINETFVLVYPNPAANYLNLSFASPKSFAFKIVDINGSSKITLN